MLGEHEMLAAGFRGGTWRARIVHSFFTIQTGIIEAAIHLVGRDVVKAETIICGQLFPIFPRARITDVPTMVV